jgi:hypothetical protein
VSAVQIDIRQQCPRCAAPTSAAAPYCRACGQAQPGARVVEVRAAERGAWPEGDEPPAPDALTPLLPTMPSRTGLVAFCAIVGLLLAASVPVLVARAVFFGPDDAVRGYFHALAARNADAAWAALAPGNVDRSADPLLRGDALRDPGYTPPRKLAVDKLTVHAGNAVVDIRFEVAGAPQVAAMKVVRGRATNLLQRWHIEDGLRYLPVAVSYPAGIQVAGTRLNASDQGVRVSAFPGSYAVTLPDNPLVEADPVTVVAGSGAAAVLQPRVKASAGPEIEKQVRAYLDGCARSTDLAPKGCPFRTSSYYDVTDVAWRITRYPTLTMQPSADGSVYVKSADEGQVEVSGRTTSTTSPIFATSGSFAVSGTAVLAGDKIAFSTGA